MLTRSEALEACTRAMISRDNPGSTDHWASSAKADIAQDILAALEVLGLFTFDGPVRMPPPS